MNVFYVQEDLRFQSSTVKRLAPAAAATAAAASALVAAYQRAKVL